MLLNDTAHISTTSYASKNAFVMVLAEEATNHSIATTAELRRVPIARAATFQKGDMVTLAIGALCMCDHLDPSASSGPGPNTSRISPWANTHLRPWPRVRGACPRDSGDPQHRLLQRCSLV